MNPVNKIMPCAKEENFDSELKAQVDEYQNSQDQAPRSKAGSRSIKPDEKMRSKSPALVRRWSMWHIPFLRNQLERCPYFL
jgi:hypothetical protein